MSTLCFVVPAYRRFDLTRVCLRQLRRTCDLLTGEGLQATAVVVGDDENLELAELIGFATIRRENKPLGRKFNDGLEYGASPRFLGCDYVMPIGTDNWVDHKLVLEQLPPEGKIGGHRLFTMVHESGRRHVGLEITYDGGDGIRTIPSALLRPLAYRPADEDRPRAVDTSIWNRLARAHGKRPAMRYVDLHELQVIGFQSADEQITAYEGLRKQFGQGKEQGAPWGRLREVYPAEAVAEAEEVYAQR